MHCSNAAPIERRLTTGLQAIALSRNGRVEHFITALPEKGENAAAVFERAAAAVREKDAQILAVDVFGVPDNGGAGRRALADALGEILWPLTWIEEGGGEGLFGIQIWAVSGVEVESIRHDGRVVGTLFESARAIAIEQAAFFDRHPVDADVEHAALHPAKTRLSAPRFLGGLLPGPLQSVREPRRMHPQGTQRAPHEIADRKRSA